MNTDQKTRLEIMKALEKDFPDRLLEDLIDVARYVEGDASAADEKAEEFHRKVEEDGDRMRLGLDPIHFKIPDTPRKWTNLDAIPADVWAVTDGDGDVIRRVALGNRRIWKFEIERYENTTINDEFGPFTEVLSNPRTWTSLADIPDNVRWVKDHEGDLIKRFAFPEHGLWVYTSHDYADISPSDEDGPFSEVLS